MDVGRRLAGVLMKGHRNAKVSESFREHLRQDHPMIKMIGNIIEVVPYNGKPNWQYLWTSKDAIGEWFWKDEWLEFL